MEPRGCHRPPGIHEGQSRFACFRGEVDQVLDHQRSPLWGHDLQENRSPKTCQVSSVKALACERPPSPAHEVCDHRTRGCSNGLGTVRSDSKHTDEKACCQILTLWRSDAYLSVQNLPQSAPTLVNHESGPHVRAAIGRQSSLTRVDGRIVDRISPVHQELLEGRARSVPCRDQYAGGVNTSQCCAAPPSRGA